MYETMRKLILERIKIDRKNSVRNIVLGSHNGCLSSKKIPSGAKHPRTKLHELLSEL
jgi:hypothetical protein